MTLKNWLLVTVAVVLATVYVIHFTDWFKPKTVQIFHTSRSLHMRAGQANTLPSLIFGLSRPLRLTEIKIVPLDAWQTNKNVLPVWHLISLSNSVPVKMFTYGRNIPGLKPAVPGDRPGQLDTNILYRIFITAGKTTGQHDFELK